MKSDDFIKSNQTCFLIINLSNDCNTVDDLDDFKKRSLLYIILLYLVRL